MRDLVMQLRELEIIQIHWTKTIEDEWARNVVEKQGADPEGIQASGVALRAIAIAAARRCRRTGLSSVGGSN